MPAIQISLARNPDFPCQKPRFPMPSIQISNIGIANFLEVALTTLRLRSHAGHHQPHLSSSRFCRGLGWTGIFVFNKLTPKHLQCPIHHPYKSKQAKMSLIKSAEILYMSFYYALGIHDANQPFYPMATIEQFQVVFHSSPSHNPLYTMLWVNNRFNVWLQPGSFPVVHPTHAVIHIIVP